MPKAISDSYRTLASSCSHEIKIKGSRFIGIGYPADSVRQALEILDKVRKKEHAASHHCFAYVVGLDREQFKYSDDGEPTGTAGKPIHQVIVGRNLKNVIVIVVRYFGGTKLGTGGLTRAYSRAAGETLDRARIVEKLICDRLRFSVKFAYYDQLMRLITAGKYRIVSQGFAERVTLTVEVRKSQAEIFVSQLTELTGGRIEIEKEH